MSFISKQSEDLILSKLNMFFENDFAESFSEDYLFKWYQNADEPMLEGVDFIFDGSSKYVMIFDEVPQCVVKFSRKGLRHDYCKLEAENYKKAINAGVDCYLARTEFFVEMGGISFYIQEKVECNDYDIESEMYNYAKQICDEDKDSMSEDEYNDLLWDMVGHFDCENSLNAVFGESYETQLLIDFCYNNKINDLHQGNFGYKGEFPVIIDFCGYLG